jgi:hypothetical protein
MKTIFSHEFVTEDEMVSQFIHVLGPMPTSWWERWGERGEFFDQDGRPREGRTVGPGLEESFEQRVQYHRRDLYKGVFGKEETQAILNFIHQVLAFQPVQRPTIEQILEY